MISMFIHAVYCMNANKRGCSGIQEVSEMSWKCVRIDNRSISSRWKTKEGFKSRKQWVSVQVQMARGWMGRQARSTVRLSWTQLQEQQEVRGLMLLALCSHSRYQMISWFRTTASQDWVPITLRDPGGGVTPYPLSGMYDKHLGLVSLIWF